MDDNEKEKLREEGRREARYEVFQAREHSKKYRDAKISDTLAYGFIGALIGAAIAGFLGWPATTITIPILIGAAIGYFKD